MRAKRCVALLFLLLAVTGCDEVAGMLNSDKFKDLKKFVGKGPNDLVSDQEIGGAIGKIVPASLSACMDDVFNYSQDVEQLPDGTIKSSALGSRADTDRIGYVSVSPAGRIDVILWCDGNRNYYDWYSNAPIEDNAPQDLIAWARTMIGRGPMLRRFGESHIRTFDTESINKGELFSVLTEEDKQRLAEERAVKARRAEGHYIVKAGSVICVNMRSFYKVNAIEISGNPYVPLPGDCDHIGEDVPVNLLRQLGDPVVGNVALVGNAGGSVYIRMKDLK